MVSRMLAVSSVSAVLVQTAMGMNHKRSLSSSAAACSMFGVFWVWSVRPCVQKSPELDSDKGAVDWLCAPAQ